MNKIEYLIISSTLDYSTDLICYQMLQEGASYLRINRDQFKNYRVLYSVESENIFFEINNKRYEINQSEIKSIYFRAPVFLRNTGKIIPLEENLHRSQWNAFIRNLILFENVKWVNHPVATYRAENKLYQLTCAKKYGLGIPETYVGNSLPSNIDSDSKYIVKSLETSLYHEKGEELFTYSTLINGKELMGADIHLAPIILQEYLRNKIDIRATVVGKKIYAVSITNNGNVIEGDWRKTKKESLSYTPIDLPQYVYYQILELMDYLQLSFGGVDLALIEGKYYFIEVNPTGEWGWLVHTTNLPIDKEITNLLFAGVAI